MVGKVTQKWLLMLEMKEEYMELVEMVAEVVIWMRVEMMAKQEQVH